MALSLDNTSSFLASIALLFFIADAVSQVVKLSRAKTSKEISLIGIVIRITGMLFFVLRFGVIGDLPLFIGQTVSTLVALIYLGLVIKYRKE